MDTKIAQKRLKDLAAAMVAKGMREPDAKVSLVANVEPSLYITWKHGHDHNRSLGNDKYKFFKGDLASAFEEAAAFIADQPTAEQAKMRDFMAALGGVIDIGRQYGIEADYLNPLAASMKKLSTNALTHGGKNAA